MWGRYVHLSQTSYGCQHYHTTIYHIVGLVLWEAAEGVPSASGHEHEVACGHVVQLCVVTNHLPMPIGRDIFLLHDLFVLDSISQP